MEHLEATKMAICIELNIKNQETVNAHLDSLAMDVMKRKNIIKQYNKSGKKNIQKLDEEYSKISRKILKKINKINELL